LHAKAKMVRVLPDQTERPVEAVMTPFALAEVLEGEKVLVKLWHGNCLEAEAMVTVSDGRTLVRLTEKKELRSDAPQEALEC
jgi:hypothetical protein